VWNCLSAVAVLLEIGFIGFFAVMSGAPPATVIAVGLLVLAGPPLVLDVIRRVRKIKPRSDAAERLVTYWWWVHVVLVVLAAVFVGLVMLFLAGFVPI
jgi:hypothetical protein